MCEYCHWITDHHSQCPNAPEPKIRGYCEYCGDEMRDGYEYYVDKEGNKFCREDCAIKYYGILSQEWDVE